MEKTFQRKPNLDFFCIPHSAWRLVKCARLSVFRVEVLLLSKRIFRGFELVSRNFFSATQKKCSKNVLKKGFEKRVSKLSAVLRCYCHLRWFIVNATFSLICFCPLQHRILLPAAPIPSLCVTRKVFFPSKVEGHR